MRDPGIDWLLSSPDPSVRYLTLTEVLGKTARSAQVRSARDALPHGPKVRALLAGQREDGGFGIHPYGKWDGAHWRLVSLVELAVSPGEPRAVAALEQVLGWVAGPGRGRRPAVNGRFRRCASQEGNALAVACRLGAGSDPRVAAIAERLTTWQWPDGGWNCDIRPEARHSSFHETISTLWGLVEHHRATGEPRSLQAAEQAAEFFLRHRVFRSERTGEPIHPDVVKLRYPPYWHFDVLQGLLVLGRAGKLGDRRTADALDLLEAKRRHDGTWATEGHRYWQLGKGPGREVVDWGRAGPNEMVTLNALRVLSAAGRLLWESAERISA